MFCNFYSLMRSLTPDSRSDAYFLIIVLNILILGAIHREVGILVMAIIDIIIFLAVKIIIYNNEDLDQSNKIENSLEMKTVGNSIASKFGKIATIV